MPTSWVPRHLKVDILTDFDYVWMNLEAQRGVHTSYVGGLGATSHPGLEIFRKMRAGEMAQAGRVIVVTTSMCNVPQCATCSEGVCGAAGQDWHEQPERHHAEVSEDSVFWCLLLWESLGEQWVLLMRRDPIMYRILPNTPHPRTGDEAGSSYARS